MLPLPPLLQLLSPPPLLLLLESIAIKTPADLPSGLGAKKKFFVGEGWSCCGPDDANM